MVTDQLFPICSQVVPSSRHFQKLIALLALRHLPGKRPALFSVFSIFCCGFHSSRGLSEAELLWGTMTTLQQSPTLSGAPACDDVTEVAHVFMQTVMRVPVCPLRELRQLSKHRLIHRKRLREAASVATNATSRIQNGRSTSAIAESLGWCAQLGRSTHPTENRADCVLCGDLMKADEHVSKVDPSRAFSEHERDLYM
jgi:hypothetical protein